MTVFAPLCEIDSALPDAGSKPDAGLLPTPAPDEYSILWSPQFNSLLLNSPVLRHDNDTQTDVPEEQRGVLGPCPELPAITTLQVPLRNFSESIASFLPKVSESAQELSLGDDKYCFENNKCVEDDKCSADGKYSEHEKNVRLNRRRKFSISRTPSPCVKRIEHSPNQSFSLRITANSTYPARSRSFNRANAGDAASKGNATFIASFDQLTLPELVSRQRKLGSKSRNNNPFGNHLSPSHCAASTQHTVSRTSKPRSRYLVENIPNANQSPHEFKKAASEVCFGPLLTYSLSDIDTTMLLRPHSSQMAQLSCSAQRADTCSESALANAAAKWNDEVNDDELLWQVSHPQNFLENAKRGVLDSQQLLSNRFTVSQQQCNYPQELCLDHSVPWPEVESNLNQANGLSSHPISSNALSSEHNQLHPDLLGGTPLICRESTTAVYSDWTPPSKVDCLLSGSPSKSGDSIPGVYLNSEPQCCHKHVGADSADNMLSPVDNITALTTFSGSSPMGFSSFSGSSLGNNAPLYRQASSFLWTEAALVSIFNENKVDECGSDHVDPIPEILTGKNCATWEELGPSQRFSGSPSLSIPVSELLHNHNHQSSTVLNDLFPEDFLTGISPSIPPSIPASIPPPIPHSIPPSIPSSIEQPQFAAYQLAELLASKITSNFDLGHPLSARTTLQQPECRHLFEEQQQLPTYPLQPQPGPYAESERLMFLRPPTSVML